MEFSWAFSIVIILILLYVLHWWKDSSRYLEGLWFMDKDFADAVKIQNMYLYFGERESCICSLYTTYNFNGYIVAMPNVANQAFTVSYNILFKSFTIKFEDEQIMPENLTVKIDEFNGKLILIGGDTIYGIFYKDHENTQLI